MNGELKGFEYDSKKKGQRVYSGVYGDGTIIKVEREKGRNKKMMVDGKMISVPNPLLTIKFDHHADEICQYDSDVGELL
jgi:hypothetical protein